MILNTKLESLRVVKEREHMDMFVVVDWSELRGTGLYVVSKIVWKR